MNSVAYYTMMHIGVMISMKILDCVSTQIKRREDVLMHVERIREYFEYISYLILNTVFLMHVKIIFGRLTLLTLSTV